MIRIRAATQADADAIAGIELASALVRDDAVRITLLRGAGLFDQHRLMDDARIFLAESDGAVVACDAVGVHHASVGGVERRLLYRHHVRVLPQHRRRGLNDLFSAHILEFARSEARVDGGYVYTDPHNALVRDWQASSSGAQTWQSAPAWRHRPLRALLRCDALSGAAAGRPATRSDASRIAALVGACHGREEMFLAYDEDRVASRLGRLPEQYGWAHLWLDGDAVVGVWEAGERCVRDENGRTTESSRAYVLDYGFDPGCGLGDFERLLRAWCARLAGRGVTHLSIFTSPGSPGEALIRSLSESVSEVQLQSSLPEPPGLAERGLYVDHVYF